MIEKNIVEAFMKRPFSFIIIPLVMGIIFSYYFHINIFLIFLSAILLIGIYIVNILRDKSPLPLLFTLFLTLGALLTTYSLNNSKLSNVVGKDLIISGTVDEIIEKGTEQGKYIIKLDTIEDEQSRTMINEKVLLKVIGTEDLNLGSGLKLRGGFSIPSENTNPNLFNYRLNLLTNKIHATITVRDYAIIEVNNEGIPLKYRLKESFTSRVEKIFDENLNEKNSSLMKSIILGEYSYLDDENISRYRDLGLAHILAVSGLHIGIIAGFIVFSLANIGVKRRYNILIALCIIWFYGFLIGFPPSLLRANIMFSILFVSQLLAEPYDTINTLSFAAFVILIMNPLWVFSLGFQLSFLATFSIAYFTPKVGQFFYPYRNKLIYTLSGLLGVQIGIMPIQAYYFNKLSILSILSNLLVAPILSIGLILGGIMIVFPLVNSILGKVLDFLLNIQDYLGEILLRIPWGIMNLPSPSVMEMILYYIMILIIVNGIRLRKLNMKIKKLIFYYLAVFILFNFFAAINDKSLEIHFIDVGQGDGILLRTNRWNYLIDTGGNIMDNFDVGKNITLPYLQKLGIRNMRGVFITHFHDDHCKSLPLLMENIKINNILVSYEDEENEIYKSIIKKGIEIKVLEEGNRINLDRGISLEVISPNKGMRDSGLSPNNLSLVFLVSYYNKNILFTGDMEKEVEWEIVDKLKKPIDIIKVPHHGSITSSTNELLNKTKPKVGIISVGRNNFYNHPANEVIERYEEIDTKLFRTDKDGMIKVILDNESLAILPFIREKTNLMSLFNENLFIIIFYTIYTLILYNLLKVFAKSEEELAANELY